jgi:hypothetical protein
MKKPPLTLIILTCFLLALPLGGFALDLTVTGGLGNVNFDPASQESLGSGAFSPSDLYPLGQIRVDWDYSEVIRCGAAFERDPLLRNMISTNVEFITGPVRLDMGPFMGVFNTDNDDITPGISAAASLEIPGILFGAVKVSSTIGAGLTMPGDYIQEGGEMTLGFWVPHVIASLSITSRGFTEQLTEALVTRDEHIRYQLGAEVFSKNVPYTVHIDMGYQSLRRSYITGTVQTDELRSIYAGFEAIFAVLPSIKLILGAEAPIYSWGKAPLKAPPQTTFMYRAHTGVSLSFF